MAIVDISMIKPEAIKPIMTAGKAIQTLASTPENEDGWTKFERIIGSIDHMLDSMVQLKNQQSGKQDNTRRILSDTSIEARQPALQAAPAAHANNAISEDKPKMNIPPQILEFAASHIADCVKENPNMTLGEAIMKLPINVTQLSVLLQMLKKAKGGA